MQNNAEYEEFQQKILENISEKLSEYGNYQCSLESVEKNNATLCALSIRKEGDLLGLNIYLEECYEKYLSGEDIGQIGDDLIRIYKSHTDAEKISDSLQIFKDSIQSYQNAENFLVCRLIAKENNMKYLDQGPYRVHPIGTIALYIEKKENNGETLFMRVTHQLAELWKQPEVELFAAALKNTFAHEQPVFTDIRQLLKEEMREHGDLEIPESEEKPVQYVLTNSSEQYGATMILYPNVMKDIRERIGEDFYILPSSLHELIIIPKSNINMPTAELKEMVMDVNRSILEPQEFLSDNIYEYRGREDRLKKCVVEKNEQIR